MILGELKRSEVRDDGLWEMVERANRLTQRGDYKSWDENADVLIPLMKKILSVARRQGEWETYFYDMKNLFILSRRIEINDVRLSFQIAELFHRDYAENLDEKVSQLTKRWHKIMANIASMILRFYLDYPQIDDRKLSRMLEIFMECKERYGDSWNRSDYARVMELAVTNRDMELAELARKEIEGGNFELWCYVCYYISPMVQYYLLHKDFDGVERMVTRVCTRSIPVRYQRASVFIRCEISNERTFVLNTFEWCLKYGDSRMFRLGFDKWKSLFEKPLEAENFSTVEVLLHALAGEWSRGEERLRLAEKDDRDRRQQREPRDCVYWSLCWYDYFRLLERQGVESVELELEEEDKGFGGPRTWSCREAWEYFERQADCLGAQMDRARKRFGYEMVKRTFEEILGYGELTG